MTDPRKYPPPAQGRHHHDPDPTGAAATNGRSHGTPQGVAAAWTSADGSGWLRDTRWPEQAALPPQPGWHGEPSGRRQPDDYPAGWRPGPAWQQGDTSEPAWQSGPGWQQAQTPDPARQSSPVWQQTLAAPEPGSAAGEPVLTPLVRGLIAHRMIAVNTAHAQYAADGAGTKDEVSAHMLVLISCEQGDRFPEPEVSTRLERAFDHNEDLLDLMEGLTGAAQDRILQAAQHGTQWEPRSTVDGLMVHESADVSRLPCVGVAMSTLDQPDVEFRQIRQAITREHATTLTGQVYLLLLDGTRVHIDRAPLMGDRARQHLIQASRDLQGVGYPVRLAPVLGIDGRRIEVAVWDRLRALARVLAAAWA